MTLSIHKNSGPPLSLGNCIDRLKISTTILPWPPNMSRNTTLHLEMVKSAEQFLMRAPQATVPEAMRVAQFLEDHIANPNIQKQILRRMPGRKKPMGSSLVAAPMSAVACSPMTTLGSDITNDKDLSCPPQRLQLAIQPSEEW
jgi:hypothetical protein